MSTESFKVPFNMPSLTGNEIKYIMESIQNRHISGDGPFTKKCQNILKSILGVPGVLLVTSCTHALEMAALLLDIRKGDEVITPSFTYVSTINAFVLRGARPVFVDVRPDTMNIDERILDGFITPRTKAIVLTHYAGVGCEMDAILDVAERHGVPLIEDNACSFLGKYHNKFLGTFGCMAAYSFHETKGLSCGQGGALGINDPSFIERAEFIRDKGTDRSKFNRGQVDKYTWVDVGSSYTLSDLLAAYLLAQLENRVEIQKKRRKIWESV
jgi:dTDP-4-amino-4,6-dideoxygalactose transaminase